ncbi:lipase family protein [Streptomyces sp. NPDC051133]|uniref:lipase family protein n=1 Tax=Streptomyces sp. NPDC051133 TaxID=3155521 RepID=UPI003415CBA0
MAVPLAFDHTSSGYSLQRAYWLARTAELALQEPAVIEEQAARWGFDRVRHHEARLAPPSPLRDVRACTLSGDRTIVIAFRGSEPGRIKDWLSDATTPPRPGPGGNGYVHHGFAAALDPLYPAVARTLAELRTDGQGVYVTGHGLGGALAMLAGARLYLEAPHLAADGVYTFGQPRTCDRQLADAFHQGLGGRMYRFVNNGDIVAQLPPEPAFTHVRALRYFDSRGRLHESMPTLSALADRAKGVPRDALASASDGIRDHSLRSYLALLEKNLV